MDELLTVVRELNAYAGPAGEESVWQGGGTIAVPIRLFVQLRKALGSVQDYNESGVHECMGCREPVTAPSSWCPRCQRGREPHPAGYAPWEVVA